jgi:hypothetical protein
VGSCEFSESGYALFLISANIDSEKSACLQETLPMSTCFESGGLLEWSKALIGPLDRSKQ